MIGQCSNCQRGPLTLPARGLCGACYDKLHPAGTRKKMTPYKRKVNRPNNGEFPKVIMIKAYQTSDDREFGNEIDALRHQLELERERVRKP